MSQWSFVSYIVLFEWLDSLTVSEKLDAAALECGVKPFGHPHSTGSNAEAAATPLLYSDSSPIRRGVMLVPFRRTPSRVFKPAVPSVNNKSVEQENSRVERVYTRPESLSSTNAKVIYTLHECGPNYDSNLLHVP